MYYNHLFNLRIQCVKHNVRLHMNYKCFSFLHTNVQLLNT